MGWHGRTHSLLDRGIPRGVHKKLRVTGGEPSHLGGHAQGGGGSCATCEQWKVYAPG